MNGVNAGDSEPYQFESGQRDGRQVDGRSLSDVNKASFQDGDGAQHMDPPVFTHITE